MEPASKGWRSRHVLALALTIGCLVLTFFAAAHSTAAVASWVLCAAALALLCWASGSAIAGHPAGILIDSRNVISLSRFQMALWTLTLLSAFLAAVIWNACHGVSDPAAVDFPPELWALMGLSTFSLVASPMALASKQAQQPDAEAAQHAHNLLAAAGQAPDSIRTAGLLSTNRDVGAAQWSDILTGEEYANAAYVDLSRLQMLLFTVVSALAYCITLVDTLTHTSLPHGITALPTPSQALLAMLTISHAGYLGAKNTTQSKTAVPPSPPSPG